MPLYRYQALASEGRKISGMIDAESFPLAKQRLRQEGILVIGIALVDKHREKELCLAPQLLLSFTREFGQLLQAGLPVYESLLTIEEKYRGHKSHPLLLDLCDRVKQGASLSTALKKYPKTFSSIYLAMVLSAEQTSSLATAFKHLYVLISRQQKLKKQLISTLTYPAFLAGFCLLVILLLFFFVIPSIEELFQDRLLHPMTKLVIALSQFVRQNSYLILIGCVSCLTLFTLFFRSKKGKIFFQQLLMKAPLSKTLMIQTAMARFCRSLSLLLSGGIPLIEGLNLAKKVVGYELVEKEIEEAKDGVGSGMALSELFRRSLLIPPLVSRTLAIAEETGRLAPMLLSLAEIYDEDIEKNLTQLTAILQPALLLTLGCIVGLVLLSILLPLTDISSFGSM